MKVTTYWKGLLSFLLLLTIVMSACKKDKPAVVSPPELFGSWIEDVPFNASSRFSRELRFSKDSIYFVIWDSTSQQVTYVQGTYRTQEDKLITNFKEIVVRQYNDRIISRAPVSGNYFENATYLLNEYKLTLNYTGYPSDGSMPATIIFNRWQPD